MLGLTQAQKGEEERDDVGRRSARHPDPLRRRGEVSRRLEDEDLDASSPYPDTCDFSAPSASSDPGRWMEGGCESERSIRRKSGADHSPAEHADRLPGESAFLKRLDLQLHSVGLLASAGVRSDCLADVLQGDADMGPAKDPEGVGETCKA